MPRPDISLKVKNNKTFVTNIKLDAYQDILKIIGNETKFYDPNKENLLKQGYTLSPYVKLFNEKYKTFPSGLTNHVCTAIYNAGFRNIEIEDERTKVDHDEARLASFIQGMPFVPRDYQNEALQAGIDNACGGFSMATGSGKSLIMGLLSNAYKFNRMLIVIDLSSIAYQHVKFYKNLVGEDNVGMIGDGNYEFDKPFTIAIVKSLYEKNRSKDKRQNKFMKEWLAGVDGLILDEYHHSASKMFRTIIRRCTNTGCRWGFSATAFRKYDDDLYLEGHVGNVIYNMSTSELIERGWLADASIMVYNMPAAGIGGDHWTEVYQNAIVDFEPLNIDIVKRARFFYERGLQFIIFVDRLEHGYKIKQMITESKKLHEDHYEFVHGKIKTDQREEIFDAYRSGDLRGLLITKLGNEGLDFPEADAAINACGGDSPVATVQKLGRILRKRKDPGAVDIDPNKHQKVYYVDYLHRQNKYLSAHSFGRLGVYYSEPALTVHEQQVA